MYSEVESWIHRLPDQQADFLVIQLDIGKALTLTPKHFIYRSKCLGQDRVVPFQEIAQIRPLFAEEVHPGDCLLQLAKRVSECLI